LKVLARTERTPARAAARSRPLRPGGRRRAIRQYVRRRGKGLKVRE
jgi:hypothetical protein